MTLSYGRWPYTGQDAGRQHRRQQRPAASRGGRPLRSARRAGILAVAVAAGGMALPGAIASAAVTGGQQVTPTAAGEAMVAGVAVMSARSVWAVGFGMRDQNFHFTPFLAHWDGRAWTRVTGGPLPPHGYLDGVTAFQGGAWAVGASGTHPPGTAGLHEPLILRLKGSTWTRVPYPGKSGGHLAAVAASSPSNAWAIGYSVDNSGDPSGQTLMVHWNGQAWKSVKPPALPASGWLTGVGTTSPDSAWAVGNTAPGAIFILHWNGRRWRRVPSPGMEAQKETLAGVTATSASNAWAVGSDYGQGKTLILHWNGRSWKRVPSPSPGGGPNSGPSTGPDNRLGAVTATSATSAWAVGWGSTRGLTYAPVILHWDGRNWKDVKAPDPSDGGFLDGVGIGPSGHAWAVGYTEDRFLPLYERWDGSAWH